MLFLFSSKRINGVDTFSLFAVVFINYQKKNFHKKEKLTEENKMESLVQFLL